MPLVNKTRNPVPERYEFSGSLPPPSVRGPFFHRDKESKSWTAHYFVCGHLKNDFDTLPKSHEVAVHLEPELFADFELEPIFERANQLFEKEKKDLFKYVR